MFYLKSKFLIVLIVIVAHSVLIWTLTRTQVPFKSPEIIPIALLGSLVAARQAQEVPSTGAAPAEAAVTEVVTPPVSVPEPVRQPEPIKPPPKPDPKPEQPVVVHRPDPKPTPVAERRHAEQLSQPERQTSPSEQTSVSENVTQTAVSNSSQPMTQGEEHGNSAAPATQGRPDGANQVVVAPSYNAAYLNNPQPPYPPMSRKMREQGRVILRVLIAVDGTARQVDIKVSSGYKRLDESALNTVRRWRFVPARRGDMPIEMWYDVPINFSLNG